jgi:hypothetical protein
LAPVVADDAALSAPATAAVLEPAARDGADAAQRAAERALQAPVAVPLTPAASCCGGGIAELPPLPAAKASCCGGSVADLPPLPALKSSCCGGEAVAGEPQTRSGASASRTVQES